MDSPAGKVMSTLAPSFRVMLGKTSDDEVAVKAEVVAVAVLVLVLVAEVAAVTEGTNTLFKAEIALCLRGSDGPFFTRFPRGISDYIKEGKKLKIK